MQNEFTLPQAADTRRLKIAGLLALVAAGGVVAAGTLTRAADRHEAQHWSDAVAVPTVHLIPVQGGSASNGLTLPGTMQAWNDAKIYAQVNGYVKGWSKDIGDHVGAGTPLGLIQTPEVDQQILQARADLIRAKADAMLAQRTAGRWSDLLATQSVSKQEADEKDVAWQDKKAGVLSAQANLDRLMAMKAFSILHAPFAGTVTMRSAQIGDFVGPNADNKQALFSVADTHAIRIYVSVPQTYSASIKPGLTVNLTVPDYPGRQFKARLIGDAGAVNPQTGAFQIQLVADNADHALRPGGYAQVEFDMPGQASTVVVPSSAMLFRSGGMQVATVGNDNRIQLHKVVIGRDLGTAMEVSSGLQRGMHIVDNPLDSLAQGELVRVAGQAHG